MNLTSPPAAWPKQNNHQRHCDMICKRSSMLLFFLFSLFMGTGVNCFATDLRHHIEILSSFDSRYTGTAGAEQSADYIEQQFEDLGLRQTATHFLLPSGNLVKQHFNSTEPNIRSHRLSIMLSRLKPQMVFLKALSTMSLKAR